MSAKQPSDTTAVICRGMWFDLCLIHIMGPLELVNYIQ